jgi:hypothetical protein
MRSEKASIREYFSSWAEPAVLAASTSSPSASSSGVSSRTEKTERVQGVYVVYGAELVFKQVSIAYAGDDFVIINEQPDKGVLLNGTTVSMYDKVVIEGGGDLFDGKIVQ